MKSKRMELLMNIFTSGLIAAVIVLVLLYAFGEQIDASVGLEIAMSIIKVSVVTVALGFLVALMSKK
jgi:hypothetical protein